MAVVAGNPLFIKRWGTKYTSVALRTKRVPSWLYSKLTACWAAIARAVRSIWFGAEVEEPKAITKPKSFRRVLAKCSIHFLPIIAAIILATLNLATFFIGAELQGFNSGYWQDFDHLALQIAAKLYELVIVASLATILMDILRQQLISDPEGLPLGLLTAKTRFIDATYLLSPEFRVGMGGVAKRWKRALLALFITACSLIALLAGPSAALLLIPQSYNDWYAGGADFYVVGSNDSLWPSHLDGQYIGGSRCKAPSADVLSREQLNMSSCVWSGHQALRQWWQTSHLARNLVDIPIQDGAIERSIGLRYLALGAASSGVSLSPCYWTERLSIMWRQAMMTAPSAKVGSASKLANLRYRERTSSISSMSSQVPTVRTTCFANQSVHFADIVDKTYYPLQAEYPPEWLAARAAAGLSHDSSLVLGKQYSFNTTVYVDSSRTAAIWLETPSDEAIGTQVTGDNAVGRSSAYLNLQFPYANNSTFGLHVSCSIDARWLRSNVFGQPVGLDGIDVSYHEWWEPSVPFDPAVFFAFNDGHWRTVRLGIDWLNALTPQLSNESYWNTLSYNLESMKIDNSTGLLARPGDVESFIGAAVSTIVVDGMSRTGYERNGGSVNNNYVSGWPSSNEIYDSLLAGSYELPMEPASDGHDTDRYKMHWSVTVTGFGFRANSTSYYLALTVVLLHVAFALGHMVWVVKSGESSTAWSSLTDLLALALKSLPPTAGLNEASGGVRRYKTLRDPVRIRARENASAPSGGPALQNGATQGGMKSAGQVEIVLGIDYSPDTYKDIVKGQVY